MPDSAQTVFDSDKIWDARSLTRRIDTIRAQWQSRRGPTSRSPYDSAPGYLKRHIYQLTCDLLKEFGSTEPAYEFSRPIFDEAAGLKRKSVKREPKPSDLLALALRAVVGTDETVMSRAERLRYVRELDYAGRHRIPDELLVGFIYQVGSWTSASGDGPKRLRQASASKHPACKPHGEMTTRPPQVWFDEARHSWSHFESCVHRPPDGELEQ